MHRRMGYYRFAFLSKNILKQKTSVGNLKKIDFFFLKIFLMYLQFWNSFLVEMQWNGWARKRKNTPFGWFRYPEALAKVSGYWYKVRLTLNEQDAGPDDRNSFFANETKRKATTMAKTAGWPLSGSTGAIMFHPKLDNVNLNFGAYALYDVPKNYIKSLNVHSSGFLDSRDLNLEILRKCLGYDLERRKRNNWFMVANWSFSF